MRWPLLVVLLLIAAPALAQTGSRDDSPDCFRRVVDKFCIS
jgi:hypothetical protein